MNFKVKITFDFDESCYLVFVEGIKELEGRGSTEVKALIDFFQNYEQFKDKEYFDSKAIKQLLEKYKTLDDF